MLARVLSVALPSALSPLLVLIFIVGRAAPSGGGLFRWPSNKNPAEGGGAKDSKKPRVYLLNSVSHAVEGSFQVRADELHGGDNHHRDAGRDETVLDRRRAGLVLQETRKKLSHGGPLSIGFRKGEAKPRLQTYRLSFNYNCKHLAWQNQI
jgi:hypothetical protein